MNTLNTAWRRRLAAALLCFLPSLPAAADAPRIEFRPEAAHVAGPVPDGTLLGRGRVAWDGPHAGFTLWLEGGREVAGHRLTLVPRENTAGAPLRVRIEPEGNQPAEPAVPPRHGLRVFSGDSSMTFRVVTDGDQQTVPGRWHVRIGAAVILDAGGGHQAGAGIP